MNRLPIIRPGRLGAAAAERILDRARATAPTYDFVGALLTTDPPPPDLVAERTVGRGPDAFVRAVECLRPFGAQRAVARVWPAGAVVEPGADVLVALGLGPVTVVAVDRVVGVVDEPRRWGFAYGTLPGHIEVGEEAFVVSHGDDDAVVVRITATAHVALPGSRLLQHLLLPIQRRYAERYLDAVVAAVEGA
ncbi:MAG TPA: DUF1990 domain-containing protein [Iamia sp.]